MDQQFNETYWQLRYKANQTGWDAGSITPPLRKYFDQLTSKERRILIPGCGNAYEAEYLYHTGFQKVYVADVAEAPLQNLRNRVQDFPDEHLLQHDFFELKGQYDLVFEQTFFCALSPDLRPAYAAKCAELLAPGGKLVGLLFNTTFQHEGPPFGGSAEEYRSYFEPYFHFIHFEEAYNSLAPRQGRELFINLQKK